MRTKIRVFFSIILVTAVAALLSGSTTAFFSRQSIIESNYLQAGSVAISLQGEPQAVDLKRVIDEPGYAEAVSLELKNSGTLPVVFRLVLETGNSQTPPFENYLPQQVDTLIKNNSIVSLQSGLLALVRDIDEQSWLQGVSGNIVIAPGETVSLELEFAAAPAFSATARPEPFEGVIIVEAAHSEHFSWATTAVALNLHFLPEEEDEAEK